MAKNCRFCDIISQLKNNNKTPKLFPTLWHGVTEEKGEGESSEGQPLRSEAWRSQRGGQQFTHAQRAEASDISAPLAYLGHGIPALPAGDAH